MNYQEQDPQLWAAIAAEKRRQQGNIELIASENIVSEGVLAAQGSVLTNKYAEGYPGKRYYGGCEYIDTFEKKQEPHTRTHRRRNTPQSFQPVPLPY